MPRAHEAARFPDAGKPCLGAGAGRIFRVRCRRNPEAEVSLTP
jgi:hypothetical protein